MLLKPPALHPGDRLAVIAPASYAPRDSIERGLAECRALGFDPVVDDRLFAKCGSVTAGSAEHRAAHFRDVWTNPSIAGVLTLRGGYGSVHLLPYLNAHEIRTHAKVLVGYSDVTSLLSFITCQCGVVTFHGPSVAGRLERGSDAYDRDTLLRSVSSSAPLGELASPTAETIKAGEARGMLIGGTLSLLVASLGTPFSFDPPPGSIFFIEEISERPYRLDRMLTQLRLAGVLGRASGLVFGELPQCDEPEGTVTAREVIADALRDFPGPIVIGLPSGHTRTPALTLPFGVQATLQATDRAKLIIEEGAVA